ncbi:hypothetical protein NL676_037401 [Syzygium grande]|nr:hypothetical protein NL676_037401 [Syzygium grande]
MNSLSRPPSIIPIQLTAAPVTIDTISPASCISTRVFTSSIFTLLERAWTRELLAIKDQLIQASANRPDLIDGSTDHYRYDGSRLSNPDPCLANSDLYPCERARQRKPKKKACNRTIAKPRSATTEFHRPSQTPPELVLPPPQLLRFLPPNLAAGVEPPLLAPPRPVPPRPPPSSSSTPRIMPSVGGRGLPHADRIAKQAVASAAGAAASRGVSARRV